MRKQKIWLSAIILTTILSIMVVGCSNTTNEATPANEGSKTRTIEHAMGKTEVPENPQKIVVLTNEGLEAVLSMGVTPVGAVESFSGKTWYPHLEDKLGDTKPVGIEMQPNLETIATLKPDLIIGNKVRQEKVYEQLSAIAPTVFAESLGGDWKNNFQLYAQALNKEEEGKKVLAEYDEKIKATKENAGDLLNEKVSVVRFLPGTMRIYQSASFSGVLLKDLGFARPENQQKEDLAVEVTHEQIPQMDGDILFYFTYSPKAGETGDQTEKEITSNPLWKNLNAVKNEKAFRVDDVIWNTAGGVLAAQIMLEDLNKTITELKSK
ncbi:iron-siderophore ABC transporter substrate-binding protein [Hazenella sp. IB182357]|uniref:Iron-siderophore ABC transporter substrate-binding protein n=1 Tax=Polycladospora coralii TaxID=2771432 RepID=A0A926RSB2_9BACL|nr:iron-siderophore ABC transporter substrate-binding protein [Polycladospora coralii]MBD1370860.1 iron-siderophore ABC transporter substrate-binding protein [Polycladospora coralii]MBS7529799.1 iron-siderophore ABC transporter substrate-binding protein [Polycladospora coralii]